MKELRADRVGLCTLGLDKKVFYQVADFLEKYGGGEQDEAHPTMKLRCDEIRKHCHWGTSDYFRYAFRYRLNRILRRDSVL